MRLSFLAAAAAVLTAGAMLHAQITRPSPATTAGLPNGPSSDWPVVAGDLGATKYSPVAEITPANVSKLTQAWTYEAAGVFPIVINNVMYFAAGRNIIALKADSGAELWKYPLPESTPGAPERRGLTYW